MKKNSFEKELETKSQVVEDYEKKVDKLKKEVAKEENFDVWNNVAGNSSFVLKVLLICICSPFSKNFFLV